MVSARQTKDKEARAVFETKTFRVSKKNRCLKFKQSVYCSQNCKTHPYGVMRLQVSIEFGKRKGSNPNSIKAWERIDATRPGEWLESSIDITRVLREKKKSRMVWWIIYFFQSKYNKTLETNPNCVRSKAGLSSRCASCNWWCSTSQMPSQKKARKNSTT